MKVKSYIFITITLLIFSIRDVHCIIPNGLNKVSWFMNSAELISIRWYVKFLFESIASILVLILCLNAINKKNYIYSVIYCEFLYQCFDLLMFIYDFRKSYILYIIFYIFMGIFLYRLLNKRNVF